MNAHFCKVGTIRPNMAKLAREKRMQNSSEKNKIERKRDIDLDLSK